MRTDATSVDECLACTRIDGPPLDLIRQTLAGGLGDEFVGLMRGRRG